MKAIIKENGEERVIKEGTLEELKTYLTDSLGDLLDWLEEEGNQWEDFTGLKTSPRDNKIVSWNHTHNIDNTNNFDKRAF